MFQAQSHAGFRLNSGFQPGQVAKFQAQATVAEFYAYQSVMHQY